MSIRLMLTSDFFLFEKGIFFQKDYERNGPFEREYLKVRQKEGRIYSDEIVKRLPEFSGELPLKNEWSIRKESSRKLINYLKQKNPKTILDAGCGNGWFTHHLAQHLSAEVFGLDVNETELTQAARLFGSHERIAFVYGDIFSLPFPTRSFDAVVLAASIQYFPNLKVLIGKLLELTALSGEIHILDSPFYLPNEVVKAKERSSLHFEELGLPGQHYFHHSWEDLNSFNCVIHNNPRSLFAKLKRVFNKNFSPFPWIKITH